jgi:hypothetical protein
MRLLLCLLLAWCSAHAATITGTLLKPDGTPFAGQLTFDPLDAPLVSTNGRITVQAKVTVNSQSTGYFSANLAAGRYRLTASAIPGIVFTAPSAAGTYDILSLVSAGVRQAVDYEPSGGGGGGAGGDSEPAITPGTTSQWWRGDKTWQPLPSSEPPITAGTTSQYWRGDKTWQTLPSSESPITAGTTSQYWRGDKTWQTLNASAVGLGAVENLALSTWAIAKTNGVFLGRLYGPWLEAPLINSDAVILSYDGLNAPTPNYAAPISFVLLLAPVVVDNITNLLAVDSIPIARLAFVVSGPYRGLWMWCPDEGAADNGKNIRRPNDIPSDEVNGRLVRISRELPGTATYDAPSIASGASTTTTLTVTGAAVGNAVAASLSSHTTQGLLLSATVSAADTVTVTLFNPTGSPVDLASGTLTAEAWQ